MVVMTFLCIADDVHSAWPTGRDDHPNVLRISGKSIYNIRETRNIGEVNRTAIGATEVIGKIGSSHKYGEG